MSASQVSKIELISNPSAKYDAAGSAGIINIKTRKSQSDGFNGSLTTSYGQGVYPKNNKQPESAELPEREAECLFQL